METFPAADWHDLFRLAGALLRPEGSRGPAVRQWVLSLVARHQSPNIVFQFFGRKLLLVTGRDLSRHVLCPYPSSRGFQEGVLKQKAMSFLAPQALTITHDAQWEQLRAFNEGVLTLDDDGRARVLALVRRSFAAPVSRAADLRAGMRRVMLALVFGEGAAMEQAAADVEALFGLVGNPLKRTLLGWREAGRRRRLYRSLQSAWQGTRSDGGETLLARARRLAGAGAEAEILQQIPHWMFTFTGSGTDLLTRTLALVTVRTGVQARVLEEIATTGRPGDEGADRRPGYLEACLLEAGRLFPPVTQTFHRAPLGGNFHGHTIPAGCEIMHYFPVTQRDTSVDPSADRFQPERWLDAGGPAWSDFPNLFLSGARACPGRSLILWVCQCALSTLLAGPGLRAHCPPLAADPVPFLFPQKDLAFLAPDDTP